ncbi:hypothetical protein [Paenibacillus xylanexedens]|uniref:hypothetical protein n=1 Tax=Paenibacillus xylanexedens TaxID=528191 RepID=UPI0011A0A759|nr:hypothetical protein [Paenibacillus xylanexedens]
MMKLLLVMFSVISPFSVQPAAVPAAHEMQWTAMEEKASEVTLAVDRSETFQHFRTLNGISLNDTMNDLLAKKGQPGHKQEDPYLGCPEYHFHDVKVGLCEDTDIIQYVHIDASENHFMLNGEKIELNIEAIHQALGKPYYVAEDGEVFLRGDQALKVYMKSGSSQINGIDLFGDTVS